MAGGGCNLGVQLGELAIDFEAAPLLELLLAGEVFEAALLDCVAALDALGFFALLGDPPGEVGLFGCLQLNFVQQSHLALYIAF